MGDRAVIGFRASREDIPVFLYSHWGGSERYRDAARVIEEARPRWTDPAYATRIAISQIVADDWSGELGFGISAGHNSFCQPDYDDVIIISWRDRTVEIVSAGDSEYLNSSHDFEYFCSHFVLMAAEN